MECTIISFIDQLEELDQTILLFKPDLSDVANNVKNILHQASASLILDFPFFGYLLSRMRLIVTNDKQLPKYASSKLDLYFNTNFINSIVVLPQAKSKIKGILIHLTIHFVYRHHQRKSNRNNPIWCLASDILVFNLLSEIQSLFKFNFQIDFPHIKYISSIYMNKTTEQIYNHLVSVIEESSSDKDSEIKNSQYNSQLNSAPLQESDIIGGIYESYLQNKDGVDYCNLSSILELQHEISNNMIEEFHSGLLQQAYSKSRGELSTSLQLFLNKKFNSTISWQKELEMYLQEQFTLDNTWTRPNKRLISQGYYFPSRLRSNITLVIGIDTSASVEKEELEMYVAEIIEIINVIPNLKLYLIECDSDIQNIHVFEYGENIEIKVIQGRGGTDFRPVFCYADEINPDLLIYFTDGDGILPEASPINFNVLWVLSREINMSFGKSIILHKDFSLFRT